MFEVDPTRWTSKQRAVPSGTGSNVAAEQCGRGDQMGFTPDEAIGCAIRSAGHSVGVAIEFFRDRRPVDGRGAEGRQFVGGVHPVRARRGVAARGSEDNCGSATPMAM